MAVTTVIMEAFSHQVHWNTFNSGKSSREAIVTLSEEAMHQELLSFTPRVLDWWTWTPVLASQSKNKTSWAQVVGWRFRPDRYVGGRSDFKTRFHDRFDWYFRIYIRYDSDVRQAAQPAHVKISIMLDCSAV